MVLFRPPPKAHLDSNFHECVCVGGGGQSTSQKPFLNTLANHTVTCKHPRKLTGTFHALKKYDILRLLFPYSFSARAQNQFWF